MKEISFYITPEDQPTLIGILRKHNIGGFAFFEIDGSGLTIHKPVQERVRAYMTGRKIVPEFVKINKVEVIVPDSLVDKIVNDVSDNFSSNTEKHGMIFVKDVSDVYEIGTKLKGESVLRPK